MPAGVPVATVAVGKSGADNAAILAAQILAVADAALAQRLATFKADLARQVDEKNARLQQQRRPA
jgi:phosphoribosylcarboxyaminoimidazole (NCAIR) mutase